MYYKNMDSQYTKLHFDRKISFYDLGICTCTIFTSVR